MRLLPGVVVRQDAETLPRLPAAEGGAVTIIEALTDPRVLSGDMWARPVGWKGQAVGIYTGSTLNRYHVYPSLFPSTSHWTPYVSDFTADWEIVSPDAVNGERT